MTNLRIIVELIFLHYSYKLQLRMHPWEVKEKSVPLNIFSPKQNLDTIWHVFSVPDRYTCMHGSIDFEDHMDTFQGGYHKSRNDALNRIDDLSKLHPRFISYSPCSQHEALSCWVHRSFEKTLFVQYTLLQTIFSLWLSACDCLYMLWRLYKQCWRGNKHLASKEL